MLGMTKDFTTRKSPSVDIKVYAVLSHLNPEVEDDIAVKAKDNRG